MKKMTEENLQKAFAGESQAHVKYLAFAAKAENEKLPNIARLFRANAYAEQVHAINHLRALSGIGKTAENLQVAMDGENFEVTEMYPAYIHVAQAQQEKAAEHTTKWALEAEKVHAGLYKKARNGLAKGNDLSSKPIQICSVCGYTTEGKAPEKCPVCNSPAEKFVKF